MTTLIEQLAEANFNEFHRTAVPAVYEEYKVFLATGEFPYIASVAEFIARKHGLRGYFAIPGATERFDHDAVHKIAKATGDNTLVKLHHEIYLASGQNKVEEMEAQAAALTAAGYRPITELEPRVGMRIELDNGKVYRIVAARNDWCLLPPKKRTNGVSLNGLRSQHEAFVLATVERQTHMNSPAVRMFKEAA